MGTISDKLMRIINTKEDIRQALISKGYDVPTSIPFKEYAKMILDLPCNADSFPDIEGIVARYSASGLTNEQMATNPVWVDKTGNGYDLQLKNFSWKGMSGVGGYGDEKVLNWYKKQYPWLFPDQAWTVVGKTNEDEDRATIANITGNGNNLVLSNFGFSENSGYGSYPFGMNVWNPDYIADQPYGTVHYPNDSKSYATTVKNNATNFRIKFRLRGLPEGGSFLIRVFDMNDLNTVLKTYTYTENGIHEFVYNDPNKPARIILYNGNTISNISEFYLDIIPEYEGYLVTDGVDDKIVSSVFGMGKDFTIVGDWKFIDNKKSGTGLVKASSFYIYNTMIGLDLYINSGSVTNSLDGIKSINAACSDGRAYDRNWNEILANTGNVVGSGGILEVSSSGGRFDRIAFKNLAIYPRILSKDDCIKAYNYLQTLKAK